MISGKGIKPNNEILPLYSLSLYNFDQNKSFNMDHSLGWLNLVLLVCEWSKHTPGEAQIIKQLKKHHHIQELC